MDTLNFDKAGGLVSAIAQDYQSGAVLMIAWMNREAFEETVRTGRAVYFSRSRNKLWRKGEESGNVQEVKEIYIDCDADAVLLKVNQIGGAACHEGYSSCFFRRVDKDKLTVVGERVFDPKEVYKKQ
jgi:phosphoribosyl-AMP cyclohydrolase